VTTGTVDGALAVASLATGPLGDADLERLRGRSAEEVAREFEVLLLAQMIGAMRKTAEISGSENGLLTPSAERRVFDGMFDQEVARSLAEKADLGIARQVAAGLAKKEAGRAAQVYGGSAESILNARSRPRAEVRPSQEGSS